MNAPKAQKGIKMSEEVSFFVHFMAKFEKKIPSKNSKKSCRKWEKIQEFFQKFEKIGKISDMKLIAKV